MLERNIIVDESLQRYNTSIVIIQHAVDDDNQKAQTLEPPWSIRKGSLHKHFDDEPGAEPCNITTPEAGDKSGRGASRGKAALF